MKILIVEDNEGNLENFGDLLELLGHTVEKLTKLQSAIDYLQHNDVGLVIADFVLNGRGDELKDLFPDMPIIIMTAMIDKITIQHLQSENFDIMRKPEDFTVEGVTRILGKYLK